GKQFSHFDIILSNPPFGTKKGGERATRDDLVYATSNKQLNFLEVIYRSLNVTGKARAAVVVPDNVLFEGGVGKEIRQDLLNKCNVHTILRLPTGIFYSQGVKTNVLFFTRGTSDTDNTKEIWYYDLRTNMPSFGKTNPLSKEHFEEFERSFEKREEKETLERWTLVSMEEIVKKEYSLDLGLIKDESVIDSENLPNPIVTAQASIDKLEEAADLLKSVIHELTLCEQE
ncbi:MAG TPA: N-6 DNA methylase, partial [Fusobacterium sp.]|uniref:N-6 DNA methylase n=1 Tax=Fusobacterium sp. TaxID=68766 RepID=UPI002F3F1C00